MKRFLNSASLLSRSSRLCLASSTCRPRKSALFFAALVRSMRFSRIMMFVTPPHIACARCGLLLVNVTLKPGNAVFFPACEFPTVVAITALIETLSRMLSTTPSTAPAGASPSCSIKGRRFSVLRARCSRVATRELKSSVCTGFTYVPETFGSSTSTSDCEVYFGEKAKETAKPAMGASRAGITITFMRRRSIAR